ncbi:MAG: SUMF1/EgtB/PvdO family nonheme iron enzyme [Saprospiraceae bacterium]
MYRKRAGRRGSNRVLRGGSWNNDADNARVRNRNDNNPNNRNDNYGFRLANTGNFSGTVFFTENAGV